MQRVLLGIQISWIDFSAEDIENLFAWLYQGIIPPAYANNGDGDICVSENVFYYDNDLSAELKQAIYDNDHGDVKIYLSMLHDGEYWIQDTINDIYLELVELYTDMCKDELTDEGFDEPRSVDMLNLIANNE